MIVWLLDLQLSPLMLWVRISIRARCTTLCNTICQRLATGQWFSPDTPVSSTNKTDCHDITKILLKVALNTIKQTNKQSIWHVLLYGTCVILTGVWEMKQRLFLLRSIKFNVAQFFYHTGGIIDHHINFCFQLRWRTGVQVEEYSYICQ